MLKLNVNRAAVFMGFACLVGGFIVLVQAAAQAVEWHPISDDNEGNVYFMDVHSLRPLGRMWTYAWTTTPIMARKIAVGTGCPVARQVRRVVVFNASDCQEQKVYKAIQTRFYNKKGELIWKEIAELVQRPAQTPKPQSVFERMHQTVCQAQQITPAKSAYQPD